MPPAARQRLGEAALSPRKAASDSQGVAEVADDEDRGGEEGGVAHELHSQLTLRRHRVAPERRLDAAKRAEQAVHDGYHFYDTIDAPLRKKHAPAQRVRYSMDTVALNQWNSEMSA